MKYPSPPLDLQTLVGVHGGVWDQEQRGTVLVPMENHCY